MRWEDERYVRIYTRDTADWLALSFDAQALFALLMRKLDRAGLLPLGKHGKRAVAAVIGHVHLWTRLEPALDELLADGCVRIEGDVLVVPNFIAAQEATMSDKQRKAEQRARDRDKAASPRDIPSRNVTGSHAGSREVTSGHGASQEVTPCRAVPCSADPEEAAAATRASAQEATQPGLEAVEVAPAPEPAAAPLPARPVLAAVREPVVVEDRPVRPLVIRDERELDQDAAELRVRLETRVAPAKLPVAAVERTNAVRNELGRLVAQLGVDRCEDLCVRLLERRKRQGLPPPATLAFFVPMLAEKAEGGDPMPEEVPGGDVNQVLAARDAEVELRWAPLLARLTPAQRETYELEKARLAAEIFNQGLWTSEQNRMLEQTEGWLFEKWSRRAASGEA